MAAKTEFKLPYVGIAANGGLDMLYGADGDFSAIITITNPVIQYDASPEAYDDYHNLLINVVKLLGDGYILQKLDVFCKTTYPAKKADEFLQQKYNEHFAGRTYVNIKTYLVITRQVKKGAFYVYDPKALHEFRHSISKIMDLFQAAAMRPKTLNESRSTNC